MTLGDLVDAGLLAAETTLQFRRPRIGHSHFAMVTDAGNIVLADGQEFRSPSRAAAVVADMRAVDGWHAWVVQSTQRSLDSLRQELLDRVATGTEGEPDDAKIAATPQLRHERLKDARQRADAEDPIEISVRDLIALWGAKGRGERLSQRIEVDLANHGLVTSPSFRKVTLDAAVQLVSAAPAAGGSSEAAPPDEDSLEQHDVGLTVGNLPSALGGLTSVAPTATFEEAITLMLLNDYSQLAVISGKYTLRGAVTWKSIAQTRHVNPAASLGDAIVHAHEVHYDHELIDVLQTLETSDFVFVRNERNEPSGIVTTADVAHAYGELATPFFLIGELDRSLRYLISRKFGLDHVISLCDADHLRGIRSFEDLSMGDYQRVLENPDTWATLSWPLDRAIFVKRLDEIREIRNDVMHFNPDPLPADTFGKLRNLLKLLREYGE